MMQSPLMNFSILVVGDCSASLSIVAAILGAWKYQVVTAKHPLLALSILRSRKGCFDLVMMDYHMPDMNGLELQRHVREEFDLPVIFMSGDDRQSAILKSLEAGASLYIVKPVRPDDLKNIWQYCIARKKEKSVLVEEEAASASGESLYHRIIHEDFNHVQPLTLEKEVSAQDPNGKKRSRDDENDDGIEYSMIPPRKSKVVWKTGLHDLFLDAINYIGLDKAAPKNILEFMNVPGLTRENIASHLQKYRIFLKKVAVADNGVPRARARNSFIGAPSSSSTSHPRWSARNNVQRQMPPDSFPRRHPQPPLPEMWPRARTQVLNGHNSNTTPVRFPPRDASGVGLSIFKDPMFGNSRVHNNPYRTNTSSLQVIRPNTGGLSITKDPTFTNSSVNSNPNRTYASTSQTIQPNVGGPRNQQIPSFGHTNVITGLTNPKQGHPPQNHSSSSGAFLPRLSNIAHYPSVNSNPKNTNFWGTPMAGGGGNMLNGIKGFMSPIGYDNYGTSSSNFGEGSSSGPYIVQEGQEPPFGFNITEPLSPLVSPAANWPETPLFQPAPTTKSPVASVQPRNAHEQDVTKNAPIVVNSLDHQHYGDGDLFYLVFNQPANKEGIPHQEVISSSPCTSMNGPNKEIQRIEISDSGYQLEDFAPWIDQDLGHACLSPIFSSQLWEQPRNAHEQDVMKNPPIVVNSLDQQHYGDGDLFYLIFNQLANKGQEGKPDQEVISSSPSTSMNGPSKKIQRIEIFDSGYQIQDFAPWIDQDLGQAIQLNGHDDEAPENRLPLPSNECSNQQQGDNEHCAMPLSEPTTSLNDLFAVEESYPNMWDEDFIDALLTGSPFP